MKKKAEHLDLVVAGDEKSNQVIELPSDVVSSKLDELKSDFSPKRGHVLLMKKSHSRSGNQITSSGNSKKAGKRLSADSSKVRATARRSSRFSNRKKTAGGEESETSQTDIVEKVLERNLRLKKAEVSFQKRPLPIKYKKELHGSKKWRRNEKSTVKKNGKQSQDVTVNKNFEVKPRTSRRFRNKKQVHIESRNDQVVKTKRTFYISSIKSESTDTSNSNKRRAIKIRISKKRRVVSRRHISIKTRRGFKQISRVDNRTSLCPKKDQTKTSTRSDSREKMLKGKSFEEHMK